MKIDEAYSNPRCYCSFGILFSFFVFFPFSLRKKQTQTDLQPLISVVFSCLTLWKLVDSKGSKGRNLKHFRKSIHPFSSTLGFFCWKNWCFSYLYDMKMLNGQPFVLLMIYIILPWHFHRPDTPLLEKTCLNYSELVYIIYSLVFFFEVQIFVAFYRGHRINPVGFLHVAIGKHGTSLGLDPAVCKLFFTP